MQDALRMEWPRIPLPGWPDGEAVGAAAALAASAARGRALAPARFLTRKFQASRYRHCALNRWRSPFPPRRTDAT